MFHDDVLNVQYHKEFFNTYFKAGIKAGAQAYGSAMAFVANCRAHTFYFNFDDLDDNLYETGHEFYREGILKFPFDECLFVFDNGVGGIEGGDDSWPTELTKNNRESFLIRKISLVKDSAFWPIAENMIKNLPEGLNPEYLIMKFTELQYKENKRRIVQPDPYLTILADASTYGLYGQLANFPTAVFDDDVWERSLSTIQENSGKSTSTLVGALMMMSTPVVDKKENVIDEKLNRRRIKSGKPLLNNFTVIGIKPQFRGECGESHTTRRAHWRRGHIRRLKDKVIPVQPCLVNWRGEEIDPKKYIVRK